MYPGSNSKRYVSRDLVISYKDEINVYNLWQHCCTLPMSSSARSILRLGDMFDALPHCRWLSIIHGCPCWRSGFPVAGACTWNTLLQHDISTPSMSVFWRHLKTFLFRRSFPWLFTTTLQCPYSDSFHFRTLKSFLFSYLLTCYLICCGLLWFLSVSSHWLSFVIIFWNCRYVWSWNLSYIWRLRWNSTTEESVWEKYDNHINKLYAFMSNLLIWVS